MFFQNKVEYLFSDKTGTLTENVMVFKKCSIDGVLFKDQDGILLCENEDYNERSVRKFLEVLSLCHTVQVAPKIPTNSTKNVTLGTKLLIFIHKFIRRARKFECIFIFTELFWMIFIFILYYLIFLQHSI